MRPRKVGSLASRGRLTVVLAANVVPQVADAHGQRAERAGAVHGPEAVLPVEHGAPALVARQAQEPKHYGRLHPRTQLLQVQRGHT